jgi:hypothetical protein
MIGDGVIAESIISFKITWKSLGKGLQPTWDQNNQEILFHSSSIYPDLLFTKAQGIATYYKYTTIDAILALLKQIDSIIDTKLGSANKSEPSSPNPENEVTNEPSPKEAPKESGDSGSYTAVVYGDKIQMLDGQLSSANIRIRHKVSANLFRKVDDETIDNSKRIWLEVTPGSGKSIRMESSEFKMEDGLNLLVQILPTIDLVLQSTENTVTPKSEKDEDYSDKIKYLRNLRMNREEDRFTRSKKEIDNSIKVPRSTTQ